MTPGEPEPVQAVKEEIFIGTAEPFNKGAGRGYYFIKKRAELMTKEQVGLHRRLAFSLKKLAFCAGRYRMMRLRIEHIGHGI